MTSPLKIGPRRELTMPLVTLGAIIVFSVGAGVWATNQTNQMAKMQDQIFAVQTQQKEAKAELTAMRSRMERTFDAVAENLDYLVRDRKGPRPQPVSAIP